MVVLNIITLALLAIGGINWGLIGIFNFNLVDSIFGVGSIVSAIIYVLVGVSALWLLLNTFASRGKLAFCDKECDCGCRD